MRRNRMLILHKMKIKLIVHIHAHPKVITRIPFQKPICNIADCFICSKSIHIRLQKETIGTTRTHPDIPNLNETVRVMTSTAPVFQYLKGASLVLCRDHRKTSLATGSERDFIEMICCIRHKSFPFVMHNKHRQKGNSNYRRKRFCYIMKRIRFYRRTISTVIPRKARIIFCLSWNSFVSGAVLPFTSTTCSVPVFTSI